MIFVYVWLAFGAGMLTNAVVDKYNKDSIDEDGVFSFIVASIIVCVFWPIFLGMLISKVLIREENKNSGK